MQHTIQDRDRSTPYHPNQRLEAARREIAVKTKRAGKKAKKKAHNYEMRKLQCPVCGVNKICF